MELTPKQKAHELVNKFCDCNISSVPMMQEEAIKMALIVTDEFISVLPAWTDSVRGIYYWQDVKQYLRSL